jgi:hypothetical protein
MPGALSSHRLCKTRPADGRMPPATSVPVATSTGFPPAYYSSPPSQPVLSATGPSHRRCAHPPECRCHGGSLPVSPSTLSHPQIESSLPRATPRPIPTPPHRWAPPDWPATGAAWERASPASWLGHQPKLLGQLKTGRPVMAHMNCRPQFFLVYLV